MDSYTFRDDLLRELASQQRYKLSTRGDPRRFNCPREDHSSPGAAWLGDHAWGCHACNFEEPLATLGDILGIAAPATSSGFTLEDYADRKGFTVSLLEEWGVRTAPSKYGNSTIVEIPYRDVDGTLLRNKLRSRTKSFWDDRGGGVHPYGLDRLNRHPNDPVLVVEGESDCHAAWHHDMTALGIPGSSVWKSEWAKHLRDRQVYVWQEPGEGGSQFVRSMAEDLPHARVIRATGAKDIADLRKVVGAELPKAISQRFADAFPIGMTPPIVTFHPLVGPRLDLLMQKKLQPIEAVPTNIPTWDAHCRDEGGGVGLARGWHVTLGANTGSGKSLLALNLAWSAIAHGERVCFVSLEMSEIQLATRLMSIVSGVSVVELEHGRRFQVASWKTAARTLDEVYDEMGGAVYVNEERLNAIEDVAACIRYEHEVHGCRYIIVDYMQLAAVKNARNEPEALKEISHTIRNLAAKHGLVSVALSQFNRQTSSDYTQPPTPQGLMGGSSLENDSDQVVLLDHSQMDRDPDANTATTRLLLAKNRHGGMAHIDVKWDYRSLRLKELPAGGGYVGEVGDAPPKSFSRDRDQLAVI
jgi:KaiC/GvpD/RAD55 family RecA-like ATPase